MPTLRSLQQAVADWLASHPDRAWPPLANLARLAEEVGEFARVLNQWHGPKRCKPGEAAPSRERAASELGDIVAVCLVLAHTLEIDLEPAVLASLERARARGEGRDTPTRRPDDAAAGPADRAAHS